MKRVRRTAELASALALVAACGGLSESRRAPGGRDRAGDGSAGAGSSAVAGASATGGASATAGIGEPFEIRASARERGWWRADGFHESGNDNMLTGFCGGCREPLLMNSYLTFPVSDFTGIVEGVALELEQVDFGSDDNDEAFSIFDVGTEDGELEASGMGERGIRIFADLESGSEYARFVTSRETSGTTIVTTLGGGIETAVLAARGGALSLGLHLATYSGAAPNYEYVHFALDSEHRDHTLVIFARQ